MNKHSIVVLFINSTLEEQAIVMPSTGLNFDNYLSNLVSDVVFFDMDFVVKTLRVSAKC